jgi:hypothetical protein
MNDYYGVAFLLSVLVVAVYCTYRGLKMKKADGDKQFGSLFLYFGIFTFGLFLLDAFYKVFKPAGSLGKLILFLEGIVIGVSVGIYLSLRVFGYLTVAKV